MMPAKMLICVGRRSHLSAPVSRASSVAARAGARLAGLLAQQVRSRGQLRMLLTRGSALIRRSTASLNFRAVLHCGVREVLARFCADAALGPAVTIPGLLCRRLAVASEEERALVGLSFFARRARRLWSRDQAIETSPSGR
jgi:hypothetical protein